MSKVLLGVVVFLILILVGLSLRQKENFDTYWNHTLGAQKIYEISKNRDQRAVAASAPDTELLAKYTWSERQKDGTQLYDKVYAMALGDNSRQVSADPTYWARETRLESDYPGHLDYKFTTLNDKSAGASFLNGGDSPLTHYTTHGMAELDPLYTVYNGEYITLSQKTF